MIELCGHQTNNLPQLICSESNDRPQLVNSTVPFVSPTDLIFVTNITNIISGEKIVMWRNFSFPCGEISDVFYCNLCRFVAKSLIHDVCREILSQFTRFHVEKN